MGIGQLEINPGGLKKWQKKKQRNDLIHKASNEITNRFDTIVIENLNVKGMMKNHKLAKSIGEAGWSEFTRMLEYKCLWRVCEALKVLDFDPETTTSLV